MSPIDSCMCLSVIRWFRYLANLRTVQTRAKKSWWLCSRKQPAPTEGKGLLTAALSLQTYTLYTGEFGVLLAPVIRPCSVFVLGESTSWVVIQCCWLVCMVHIHTNHLLDSKLSAICKIGWHGLIPGKLSSRCWPMTVSVVELSERKARW